MASVNIPADTYRRLTEKAAALKVSVEELVCPVLESLAQNEATLPLRGEAWKREFDAWTKEVEDRAKRFPPGFRLDDSRESIYGEREDSQI